MGRPDARSDDDGQEPSEGRALSWNAVVVTYLPALVLGLGLGIALPAIPDLARSFEVGFGLASMVMTSYLIGNVVATIPSGWLVDRFGDRPIAIVGPLLTASMALLVVFSDSFLELLVLRFVAGFANQMWLMARLAAISSSAAPNQRGRLITWLIGMENTGKAAGPLVGGFIAAGYGIRAPFAVYAVLATLAAVPAMSVRGTLPRRPARSSGVSPSRIPLREIVRSRFIYFGVAFFAGLTRGPHNADLFYLYASFAYDLGPAQIGYLATTATLLYLPLGFLAGVLMDRFGRKRTMVPGFSGVAVFLLALGWSAFSRSSLPVFVGLFLCGVSSQALTAGSVQTIGADVAPDGARARFLGWWRFTGQAAQLLGPVLFAFTAATVNYGSSFVVNASFALATIYLLVRFVPETRTPSR